MKFENVFWGILLVLTAVLIIVSQVVSFGSIGVWSILTTVFLLAVIVSSMVRLEFFGIFVPCAFLYMIYAEPFDLPTIQLWVLLIAAVLVGAGCSLIFKKKKKETTFVSNVYYGESNETPPSV